MAQKDLLAFDEHGKYIYYKEGTGAASADTLYNRGLLFFKSDNKDIKLTNKQGSPTFFSGRGVLMVYKPSLTKHPEGQVAYTFKIEIKDFKYRYWLTDFVYTPYFRDRYNNYVAKDGIAVPLEKQSTNLPEKDKAVYLADCAAYAQQFGDRFKKVLTETSVIKQDTTKRKVIHIDKW